MTTNNRHKIFIKAAKQISIQKPLSEDWMKSPIYHEEPLAFAMDPPFKDYISTRDARRMGKLIKRALTTSLVVMKETGIEHPEAIISGTSIGSLDCTEKFLDNLVETNEQILSPTYFMQSPHNTVGSAIGIYTKNHSYNITYSHGACSFDLAVQDAWMQMQLGNISNALVGGFDEMVPSYFELLRRTGYVGKKGMVPCSEVSMSMIASTENESKDLCELSGIRIGNYSAQKKLEEQVLQLLQESELTLEDVGGIMTGINGNAENDSFYQHLSGIKSISIPLLRYKHIFGENYTSPALGFYTAAHCLKRGAIQDFLYYGNDVARNKTLRSLLLVNHMNANECSLILLKKI